MIFLTIFKAINLKSLADKNDWVDFLVEANKIRTDLAPLMAKPKVVV
jgi:hypothetical protein